MRGKKWFRHNPAFLLHSSRSLISEGDLGIHRSQSSTLRIRRASLIHTYKKANGRPGTQSPDISKNSIRCFTYTQNNANIFFLTFLWLIIRFSFVSWRLWLATDFTWSHGSKHLISRCVQSLLEKTFVVGTFPSGEIQPLSFSETYALKWFILPQLTRSISVLQSTSLFTWAFNMLMCYH